MPLLSILVSQEQRDAVEMYAHEEEASPATKWAANQLPKPTHIQEQVQPYVVSHMYTSVLARTHVKYHELLWCSHALCHVYYDFNTSMYPLAIASMSC